MNRIFLTGNITSDIWFDVLNGRPFLRLILMAGKPREVKGLRVILWDDKAKMFYPYLQKGSEIGVMGHFVLKKFKDRMVPEIDASNLILLRNINWENGEGQTQVEPTANSTFVVGGIQQLSFEWREKKNGGNGSAVAERQAYMRFQVINNEHLNGLWVGIYGSLAQISNPYLKDGSVVAVDGHLHTRGPEKVELVSEHIAFLKNIDWDAGTAAQKRLIDEEREEEGPDEN